MKAYPTFNIVPELTSCLNIGRVFSPSSSEFYIALDPAKGARIKWAYQKPETDEPKEKLWMLKIDR